MHDLMNDLMSAIGPIVVIVITVVIYVVVMQVVNDSTCAAMDLPDSRVMGRGLIKILALCPW